MCDFHDNITIEEFMTFSNKRMLLCFPILIKTWKIFFIIFCFCIFMRLLSSTETHIMFIDMVWLLKVTLICVQNIKKVIPIFMISFAKIQSRLAG